jgi:hypothetical protein
VRLLNISIQTLGILILKIELDKSDWYKNLHYEEVPINAGAGDGDYTQQYVQAGHQPLSLLLDRCHLDAGLDELQLIVKQFNFLALTSYCVHRLRPGHYIPTHVDHYSYFATKNNISDIKLIHRYIVFLEDSQDGHVLIVNNQALTSYQAGDVHGWTGTTPHAALNFGLTDRYTLQITGIKNA